MYQDKLKINDDKTEFLIIGSRQKLMNTGSSILLLQIKLTTAMGCSMDYQTVNCQIAKSTERCGKAIKLY